jgi:chromosomal replication initiation ATPase DnaA
MKKTFVRTQNVKNFISLMNSIQNKPEGVPRMALVYGEPGLGKSRTALWWAVKNDAVYLRSSNMMSGRWFLEELIEELGESPLHKSSDIFNQVINQLNDCPRTIIVDEIDYLLADSKAIETLRDIYDRTNVPIILIGMGKANKKFSRFRHIYDRFSEILKFESFDFNEVSKIIEELSEVQMDESAVKLIFNQANRFRQIVSVISKAEKLSKSNSNLVITAEILQSAIKDIIEDKKL